MRKTDKKNEKMRDYELRILEAFGGGNDRKFKIIKWPKSRDGSEHMLA